MRSKRCAVQDQGITLNQKNCARRRNEHWDRNDWTSLEKRQKKGVKPSGGLGKGKRRRPPLGSLGSPNLQLNN